MAPWLCYSCPEAVCVFSYVRLCMIKEMLSTQRVRCVVKICVRRMSHGQVLLLSGS